MGFRRLGEPLVDPAKDVADVADDADIGLAILPQLGRVDVDVQHASVGSEGVEAPGDAIIEAHAKGDQRVGFRDAHIGGVAAVHAKHADEVRVIARQGAESHHRQRHRRSQQARQFLQLGRRRGCDNAASGVDVGALGFPTETGPASSTSASSGSRRTS